MPRRRLHGETQKRRRKPQTRLLKRKDSIVRVRATHLPAAFERSTELEREDLAFLEAMRELEVQRNRVSGESQARRQAIETVEFLSDEGEGRLFANAMTRLGVRPLGGDAAPPRGGNRAPPAQQAGPGGSPPGPSAPTGPPTPTSPATSAIQARAPSSAHPPQAHEASADTPAPTSTATPSPAPARPTAVPEPTVFEGSGSDAGLMELLLRDEAFDPERKFAGIGPPPLRPDGSRGAARKAEPEGEPDSELDLHGKTQEEAIRMVQNFLLVGHRQRLRRLLIITGRGHNSGEGGPVLKEAVFRWLERNGSRFVREYRRAPGRLGGDGAIWVVLR